MTSLKAEGMTIDTYRVEDDNARGIRINRGPDFDARTRVWFTRAQRRGGPAGTRSQVQALRQSRNRRFAAGFGCAGRAIGVVTGDVALVQIGRYLRAQSIGRSGSPSSPSPTAS